MYNGHLPHRIEDWSDQAEGVFAAPITLRTVVTDGITCERVSADQWGTWPNKFYNFNNAALSDPARPGEAFEAVWDSPATIEHLITATEDTVGFSVTMTADYLRTDQVAQVDVEITTYESGFDGPSVARFRSEVNQSTMGAVSNAEWGVLQADGSYVDGGVNAHSFYTVLAYTTGDWEIRSFGPPGFLGEILSDPQSSGTGTALVPSPSNRYRIRMRVQHGGEAYWTLENQIIAWTVPPSNPPVTRLYPRDDGLGIDGNARIYPPPKSRRIVGGHL